METPPVLDRIKIKEIHLVLDEKAKELLIEKGYDPAYGARLMRRAVERFLEDPLAEALLRGDVKPGDSVEVVKKPETETLDFLSTRPDTQPEHDEAGV